MKLSTSRVKRPLELADLWASVPLFWRFQLTGWAAFAILTLPIKLTVSSSALATIVSFTVRDGFSFVLEFASSLASV